MKCDHCGSRRARWNLTVAVMDRVATNLTHLETVGGQNLCTECFKDWCAATWRDLRDCLRTLRRER